MSKLLVVIDCQNDFIYGPLGTNEARRAVPYIVNKIENTDADCIVYTMDSPYEEALFKTDKGHHLLAEHCCFNTEGLNIIPEIEEIWQQKEKKPNIIYKNTFGTLFWETWLGDDIFDEIEIIGVNTDICVISNALILKSLCPDSIFVVDALCCAGTTSENHNSALKVMKACHMEILNWEEAMKPREEPFRDTYVGYWLACPNCGYEDNLASMKFCANCGQEIDRSELDEVG